MSLLLRFLVRPLARAGFCFLLVAFVSQQALAQQAPAAKDPITIVIDGTESAEALKKVIDGVSADGHPVSISLAPKPSAALGSKATGDDPFEGVFDLFVRGLRQGWSAIPKAPQYFSDFARWWHSPPESAGLLLYLFKLIALLGLSCLAGWLVSKLLSSIGPSPPTADPAPLEVKLRQALVRLLKDIAAVAVLMAVAWLLFGRIFSPLAAEGKLTGQLLQVLPAIAAFIVVGRFLLSPDEPRLQLFMLPRAKRHFWLLAGYAVVTMVLLAIFVGLGDEIGSVGTTAGIFVTVTALVLLFRIWWFWDARQDIGAVILSGPPQVAKPDILRRLFAVATPWLLILIAVLLWAIGRI